MGFFVVNIIIKKLHHHTKISSHILLASAEFISYTKAFACIIKRDIILYLDLFACAPVTCAHLVDITNRQAVSLKKELKIPSAQ